MSRYHLLLAALLLVIRPTIAVQLSELSDTNDNRFYPNVIHTFFDGTVLVSATSTYGYDELALHPIVTVPDPPPPALLSETVLLARVYPQNQTMVWATAITTIETNFGSTVDPAGNVYIVSDRHAILDPPESTFTVIKYSFSGRRLYEASHSPPLYPPSEEFTGAQYRVSIPEEGKGTLFYLARGKLLVPGAALTRLGNRRLALLTLNAFTGDFLRIRRFRLPKGVRPFTITLADFAVVRDKRKNRRSHVACLLFRANLKKFSAREGLYLQCAALKGKRRVVTRLVDGSNVTFFRFNYLAAEKEPPSNRAPSVFVAYERARNYSPDASRGESNATHELVLTRLDTSRLSRVDWASGGKGKLRKPLVVRVPTPAFPGFAIATISMQHLRETNSVALLLSTTTKFVEIKQQEKPGQGITIVGEPGAYIFPEVYWGLFFDRKQRLLTRFVEGDPRTKRPSRFRIILEDMAFTLDERCAHMFGFLTTESVESGPLYIHNTSNPIISKSMAC